MSAAAPDREAPPTLVVGRAGVLKGPLPSTGPRVGATAGEPMTATLALHGADGREPRVGAWESTPGTWEIEGLGHDETFVVIHGRARLTDAGGEPVEVTAGDVVLLPRGWHGTWEICETLRKIYVNS